MDDFFVSMATQAVMYVCGGLLGRRLLRLGEQALANSGRGRNREGYVDLTFETVKDGERRRRSDRPTDSDNSPAQHRPRRKRAGNSEVGTALRSVYQRTVDEDIPPEMLDLLGKLG